MNDLKSWAKNFCQTTTQTICMSRIAYCPACAAAENGVKTRIALEHTCGLEHGALPTASTQLPAEALPKEWLQEIDNKAGEYAYQNHGYVGDDIHRGYVDGATEYAIRLRQCDKANSALEEKNMGLSEQLKEAQQENERISLEFESYKEETSATRTANVEMIKLLKKVKHRHEGGLLPDRLLYTEIKMFLDGK
jgi:hypothetical protein